MSASLATGDEAHRALSALCHRLGVRRLDLFGSAADGRFDAARSDLDFLVDLGAHQGKAYADAYFALREGLEALYGRPVDLLSMVAIENPHLRARVAAQRRQLYPAP